MGGCELCGKESSLNKAQVEDVTLRVCNNCLVFGKILEEKKIQQYKIAKVYLIEDDVVENCGNLIKNAREKKGITQKELADNIKERESLISKIEKNEFKPNISTAKKFEKFFSIKLIYKEGIPEKQTKNPKAGMFTIGDAVKSE